MLIRICSWCGQCQGTTLEGEGATHTICNECSRRLEEALRLEKRDKVIAGYARTRREPDDE